MMEIKREIEIRIIQVLRDVGIVKKKELYFLLYLLLPKLFFQLNRNFLLYNKLVVDTFKELKEKNIVREGKKIKLKILRDDIPKLDPDVVNTLKKLLEEFERDPTHTLEKIFKERKDLYNLEILNNITSSDVKKKGVSPLIATAVLILITVTIGLLLIFFSKEDVEKDIKKITGKKQDLYQELESSKRIEVVTFSQDIRSEIIKKFLEQQSYYVTVTTFTSFYKNYKEDNTKNLIFLGKPSEDLGIKLLNVFNDLKTDKYKVVILYDDSESLPPTITSEMGIEKFRYLEVNVPIGVKKYFYKLPTPIVHILKDNSIFPSLSQEYFIERVTSTYKKVPYLYLSEGGNVVGERRPAGMITIDPIFTSVYSYDTLEESGTFYYANFNGVSQPILFISFGDPSYYNIYVMCNDRNGIAGDFVTARRGDVLSCDYLRGWRIEDANKNNIVLKDPSGNVYKVPIIVYDSLDLNAGGTIYLYRPIIIDNIVYPLIAYQSSGNIYYLFDFLKTGNGYIFDRYENINPSTFFSLGRTPFKFGLSGNPGNDISLQVKGYKEEYIPVSIAYVPYGFSKIFLIYAGIIQENSQGMLVLKDIFSKEE